MKLKQMIAAGVKVGAKGEGDEKKKAVYDKKKKDGRRNPQQIKVYILSYIFLVFFLT
jgi:translation initiation factor 5B